LANFQGHLRGAAIGSGILSSGLLSLNLLSTGETVTAFLVGTMGGLLPDLDSDNSKPFVVGSKLFVIFLASLVMFSKSSYYSLLEMAVIWIIVYLILRFGMLELFRKFTKHRGMFHSIPAGIISGLLLVYLSFYIFNANEIISWLYGFFIFFGYMIHLLMDEFVSLNLTGKKIKRSFGTAFKLYNKKDKITTIAVYIAIIPLIYFSPSFTEFGNIFGDIELVKSFFLNIFPEGVWFENFFNIDDSS
jgi:hypothetical protein